MDAFVRFYIYSIFIPFYRMPCHVRDTVRGIRVGLGLKAPSKQKAPRSIPSVPWRRLCGSGDVVFREIDKADGNVNVVELAVLNALCRTYKPTDIMEIGTFDGRTTLNLAINSDARVFTLDLPPDMETVYDVVSADKKYIDKKSSGSRFAMPPNNALPCAARITQLYGDSASFDFSPWHGKIDFVFVDGSHVYDYVVNDTHVALRLLRPEGGVIVWHDYGVWPGVTQALEELNRKMPELAMTHVRTSSLVVSVTRKDGKVG